MSAESGHLGWRSGSLETILKIDHLRTRFLNIFPIGYYVKTMSADGGHFGWRFGSLDIILKVDHSCHVFFKLAYWFQRKNFLNIFPIAVCAKNFFNN